MNCTKAREILNSLIDGEEHTRAAEAREHTRQCAACREWNAGMERTLQLMEASPDVPPELDVAAAVMARLPERHPASVTRPEGRRFSKRVLVWVGAGWLIGVTALIVAGFGLWNLLPEESMAGAVVRTYGSVQTAGLLLESVLTGSWTLIAAVRSIVTGVGAAAGGLGLLMIQLLVFDTAVLLVITVMWRRRRAAAGVHSILA